MHIPLWKRDVYFIFTEGRINLIADFTFNKLYTKGICSPEKQLKIKRRITEVIKTDKGFG